MSKTERRINYNPESRYAKKLRSLKENKKNGTKNQRVLNALREEEEDDKFEDELLDNDDENS